MMVTYPAPRQIWNKGLLVGPKPPLKPRHIWAIRTRLQLAGQARDLALFNCAIDTKLRGSDLVKLTVADVSTQDEIKSRSAVVPKRTGRPVPFEIYNAWWPAKTTCQRGSKSLRRRPQLRWWHRSV